jgi:spore coat polysaccharide biosynthesis protein SpsF (cytidylyltransferase family)
MNKNTKFSGKPVLSQVLDFIPKDLVYRTAKELNADRYYKKFTTHDLLNNNAVWYVEWMHLPS